MVYRLWIKETDQNVWHDGVDRLENVTFRAACGWTANARHTSLWPQKTDEPGPPDGERCHACVVTRLAH